MYEGKASQAEQANQKVLAKYESLHKYVKVCGGNENDVIAIMPKVQVSQFIEQNKHDFEKLKNGAGDIKHRMEELDNITCELKAFFTKMDFNKIAQN